MIAQALKVKPSKERHTAPDGAAVDASRGGRECRRLQEGESEIRESGELTPARRRTAGAESRPCREAGMVEETKERHGAPTLSAVAR